MNESYFQGLRWIADDVVDENEDGRGYLISQFEDNWMVEYDCIEGIWRVYHEDRLICKGEKINKEYTGSCTGKKCSHADLIMKSTWW